MLVGFDETWKKKPEDALEFLNFDDNEKSANDFKVEDFEVRFEYDDDDFKWEEDVDDFKKKDDVDDKEVETRADGDCFKSLTLSADFLWLNFFQDFFNISSLMWHLNDRYGSKS